MNDFCRGCLILVVGLTILVFGAWAQDPELKEKKADPPVPSANPSDSEKEGGVKAKAVVLPLTEAEKQLDALVKKLAAIETVSADIVEKVDMLGQVFELRGDYLKASSYLYRLELKLAGLGDTKGTMLQVCDGETIWEKQQVMETSTGTELALSYRKRDLKPLLEKLDDPEFGAERRDMLKPRLGLAGPESLLTGLRRDIRFETMEEAVFEGHPVWIFRGRWVERARLALNKIPGAKPDSPLPDYVPSVAAVWVDRGNGWPYQVRLSGRKRTALEVEQEETKANTGADGRPLGPKLGTKEQVQPTEVLITYTNVNFHPKIDRNRFAFQVPEDHAKLVVDETEFLASSLQKAMEAMANEKKAEEAGASVPAPKDEIGKPPPVVDPPK